MGLLPDHPVASQVLVTLPTNLNPLLQAKKAMDPRMVLFGGRMPTCPLSGATMSVEPQSNTVNMVKIKDVIYIVTGHWQGSPQ